MRTPQLLNKNLRDLRVFTWLSSRTDQYDDVDVVVVVAAVGATVGVVEGNKVDNSGCVLL